MIFVILGIIILIVSFAVALVSLVREQRKEQYREPETLPSDSNKANEELPNGLKSSGQGSKAQITLDLHKETPDKLKEPEEANERKWPWDEPQDLQQASLKENRLDGVIPLRDLVEKEEN